MPEPLVPARPAFTADGTPFSTAYDDLYYSKEGGPGQARHVFLAGNDLPARWRGRPRFVVLETGFGLGLNFLATWAAWRADAQRPARLHFVSIEKHPFSAADLATLHACMPEFAALSAELRGAWPMLVPGAHRLEFDAGRVVLTVFFGDARQLLPALRLEADALYLDGFSPAKNPEMWSAEAMKALARLAASGATLATWSTAAAVREALSAAGFALEKRNGFGAKRDMVSGRIGAPPSTAPPPAERSAIVIGAGLAGSAVCERLAARGWRVTLIERHAQPAQEASGNHAGAFHPLVTRDDSIIARLSRASFLYALRHWPALGGVSWAPCGLLQMARDEAEDSAQRAALAGLGLAPEYARYLPRAEAAGQAGCALAAGGVWFAQAGWAQPVSLVRALLAKAGAELHFGTEVALLERAGSGWIARDAAGGALAAAPIVVLANAADALRLVPQGHLALRRVRGQVTYLPAEHFSAARAVLVRGGGALPPVEGIVVAGASYDLGDEDPQVRIDGHAGNLERLARVLPGAEKGFDPALLTGRVGFRTVAIDRLPLVGAIADEGAALAQRAEVVKSGRVPRIAGLHGAIAYASRGILWCSLMAELLASELEGEPLPLEAELVQAVDPGRFLLRALRRGRLG